MDISLLIAEPNMGRSALDQQDFILDQMPVFVDGCAESLSNVGVPDGTTLNRRRVMRSRVYPCVTCNGWGS